MPKRETDPYINCRFELELNQIKVAGFAECTGLNVEVKVFEIKEGGNNETTYKLPEGATYGNITLKRGITNSNELLDWQLEIARGQFGVNPRVPLDKNNPQGQANKVAILLLSEDGEKVVKRWDLIRAFPVKWIGPELKGTGNDVAIETLEIAIEGIQQGQVGTDSKGSRA
jgi:phage tail-like protein